MNMLVPLTCYRVRYETATGRPYSDLDKLVLEAIAGGINSLSALRDTFKLRDRLLIEVLVTLARAGWIAIDVANGGRVRGERLSARGVRNEIRVSSRRLLQVR